MQVLVTLLVFITLAEMMFLMGLKLSFSKVLGSLKGSPRVVIRALVANYLIIPCLTILILLIFKTDPMVATGLLILGVTPAAPYGPPFALIARGNFAIATGLMALLAGTSAFIVPLLLHLLHPLIATDLSLTIDPIKLIGNLLMIQLIPLALGLSLSQWKPAIAARLVKPAGKVSLILNMLMMSTIMILQFRVLSGINPSVVFLMIALIASGVIAGWVLGWPGRENRTAVSIISGMRNMGLSIGIAAMSYPGSAVVTTVISYSFIAGIGLLGYAYLLKIF